jgi:hypothetical protein
MKENVSVVAPVDVHPLLTTPMTILVAEFQVTLVTSTWMPVAADATDDRTARPTVPARLLVIVYVCVAPPAIV